ncbi:MAG: hypothetical protein CVT96_11745, partial [Bacteroidetes bacterium HGW-Bacteroidetes-13]
DTITLDKAIENYKPESQVQIVFERYGKTMEKTIELKSDTQYNLILKEDVNTNQKENRAAWLKLKN